MTDHTTSAGATAPHSGERTLAPDPQHAPAVAPLTDEQLFAISTEVANVVLLARMIDIADVEEWARHAERVQSNFDTVTSLLDPTRWMRDRRAVAATTKTAAAFLELRRVIEQVKA